MFSFIKSGYLAYECSFSHFICIWNFTIKNKLLIKTIFRRTGKTNKNWKSGCLQRGADTRWERNLLSMFVLMHLLDFALYLTRMHFFNCKWIWCPLHLQCHLPGGGELSEVFLFKIRKGHRRHDGESSPYCATNEPCHLGRSPSLPLSKGCATSKILSSVKHKPSP